MSSSAQERSRSEGFTSLSPRDNFYQSVSFFPMPFAMVTTRNERGTTSIGPHSLVFPLDIIETHSMMLVSRASSNTATNLRRTGKCSLGFIEFDRDWLTHVVALGYPGQTPEEKMASVPFELADTPTPELAADPDYPQIMADAFQVYECEVDGTFEYRPQRITAPAQSENFFALRIRNVLLKESFLDRLKKRSGFPDMPISYGFRGGNEFWFTRHEKPFGIPVPRSRGDNQASIYYLANKLDPAVRFSDDACRKLTSVPRPFLEAALSGVIFEAKKAGVRMVDEQFLDDVRSRLR